MPERSRSPRAEPRFFPHPSVQCKAPGTFPARCWHPRAAAISPSLHTHSRTAQPAAARQTAASLPVYVFCWGTRRACLANEKLLWIPLWAFQEGLARCFQSRHGKTVCFSKYIRDFSGTWLWQGLSTVVSRVVSLLGCTNRKVLSGIDTGLLGLSLSGVPAQIQARLIASESCYLLTALPRSGPARSKQRGLRRSFPAEDAGPRTGSPPVGQPLQGGQQSPNNPSRSTEPPSHPPPCPCAARLGKGHPPLMAREQKLWL